MFINSNTILVGTNIIKILVHISIVNTCIKAINIADIYPKEVHELDYDETLTEAQRNERVNKMKETATKEYLIKIGLQTPSTRGGRKVIEKLYDKYKSNELFIEHATKIFNISYEHELNYKPPQRRIQSFINMFSKDNLTDIINNYEIKIHEANELQDELSIVRSIYKMIMKCVKDDINKLIPLEYKNMFEVLLRGFAKSTGYSISYDGRRIKSEDIVPEFCNYIKEIVDDNPLIKLQNEYKILIESVNYIMRFMK